MVVFAADLTGHWTAMFPSALNRIMPWVWLAMGLLAIITLAQTLEKSLEKIGLVNWVEHHGLLLAYSSAAWSVSWLLVILGALRQRDRPCISHRAEMAHGHS